MGLSSSFIEPLESTSLFLTVQQLETFKQFVNEIDRLDETSISLFNTIVKNNMEEVLCFVYLHYMTKRKDSEFWRTFADKYPPPEKLKNLLEFIKAGNLRYYNLPQDKVTASFSLASYLQVSHGIGMLGSLGTVLNHDDLYPNLSEYKRLIDQKVAAACTVDAYLKRIKVERLFTLAA